MKVHKLFIGIILFGVTQVFSQVKIGDNPQTIDPAAVLELESTTMALIITRVSTEQMEAIVPGQGALVYNTDTACVHYYNGTEWVNLCAGGTGNINVTTDPIVNQVSTIILTETAEGNNLEVAPNSIRTEQIVDGGIFGDDINDNSIGANKLANNSVGKLKISENAVGPFAIDRDSLPLSFFINDVPFLTAGDLTTVSGDDGNALTIGSEGGAFYNQQPLTDAITANTTEIANDLDRSPENELQNLSLAGNLLTLSDPINGDDVIDLESFAGGGGDPTDELITDAVLTGTDLIITEGGNDTTIPLGALAGSNQTALEVPFDPYLTIEATDTQTAVQELKDEVDVLSSTGGGSNNLTFEVTTDSLQITDGAGTLGVPLTAIGSGGGNNVDFLVANDSLEIVDAAGSLKVALTELGTGGSNQTAAEEAFAPYLTLEAINTQAAVEELKDEVDALTISGGGTNLDFTIANDSIQITDAAGTLGIALSDLGDGGGNNIDLTIANDSLNITDLGGTLSVALDELGGNSAFAVVDDSLRITDTTGSLSVALSNLSTGGNNTDVTIANDSLLVIDEGGSLGVPLSDILGNSGLNTNFEVANDSLQITDSNDTYGVALSELGGEVNTTSNAGTGGIEIVLPKDGTDFPFKSLIAGSNKVTLTDNTADNEIEIDINEANLALPANQITYDPTLVNLLPATVTDVQAAIDELAGTSDSDEQDISGSELNAETLTIGIQDGQSEDIDLSPFALETEVATLISASETADGDRNATNELQNITSTDNTVTITRTDNNFNLSVAENTVSGTTGSIFFADSNGSPTDDNAELFWDVTNDRLGIGVNTPSHAIHTNGSVRVEQGFLGNDGTFGEPSYRFNGDSNTGMYHKAADELGFSVGGNLALTIDEPRTGITNVIVEGAFSTNIRVEPAVGTVLLLENDHTVIIQNASTINLPPSGPGFIVGQIYI